MAWDCGDEMDPKDRLSCTLVRKHQRGGVVQHLPGVTGVLGAPLSGAEGLMGWEESQSCTYIPQS